MQNVTLHDSTNHKAQSKEKKVKHLSMEKGQPGKSTATKTKLQEKEEGQSQGITTTITSKQLTSSRQS